MFTDVRGFFKVDTIPWEGWLYSVLTGAGSLPVSFLVKYIVRCALASPGKLSCVMDASKASGPLSRVFSLKNCQLTGRVAVKTPLEIADPGRWC